MDVPADFAEKFESVFFIASIIGVFSHYRRKKRGCGIQPSLSQLNPF